MENVEKFVCLGDCQTCEALLDGKVDPILCPIRVLMGRTSRLERTLNSAIELLNRQSANVAKPKYDEIIIEEPITE